MKVNLEPTFGSDLTEISPPISLMIILEIVSPRPMPPRFMSLVFETYPKNLKSFNISSDEIPTPVSTTEAVKSAQSTL